LRAGRVAPDAAGVDRVRLVVIAARMGDSVPHAQGPRGGNCSPVGTHDLMGLGL
jgi:hypothetical protein